VPECPEEVRYLVDWSYQLFGRSGVGMSVNPLSYQTVAEWGRLTDTRIAPHEVEALMVLDAAIRQSSEEVEAKQDEAPAQPAWPSKPKP
jgi:hypothetical protein